MDKVIGLVGYPGAGKSYVSKLLNKEFGFVVINADLVGHTVLIDKQDEVVKAFGRGILLHDRIDRERLASIVFCHKEFLDKLNSILHPEITRQIEEFIKKRECSKYVIEAALLFESGLNELCDEVWLIDVPFKVRLRRVKERGWDGKELISREIHFLPEEELKKRVDRIFLNVGPVEMMIRTIRGFLG